VQDVETKSLVNTPADGLAEVKIEFLGDTLAQVVSDSIVATLA